MIKVTSLILIALFSLVVCQNYGTLSTNVDLSSYKNLTFWSTYTLSWKFDEVAAGEIIDFLVQVKSQGWVGLFIFFSRYF